MEIAHSRIGSPNVNSSPSQCQFLRLRQTFW
uniref:Uncharacterized protein n=1 Tax=Anguilla anguilla TaxID=7936 RepID=A0A0E9V289_ANGAN